MCEEFASIAASPHRPTNPCPLPPRSYSNAYDPQAMLFMDYRRHHTGIWEGSAPRLTGANHPNANDGLWGSAGEVPSFLYAMPLQDGRVFLEETCLVARPALPFAVLKRRLERRMASMGIKVKKVWGLRGGLAGCRRG